MAQTGELKSIKKYEGVQRSNGVQFSWKPKEFQRSILSEEGDSVSVICELL
jgi:hypothetical protein